MAESIKFDENHYGKGSVKVAKVIKNPTTNVDEIKEFNVFIQLYGDFETSYTIPTNQNVIPTDTMKNTVYVLAKKYPMNNIIEFANDIATYFLDKFSHVAKVNVDISEVVWNRVVMENNLEHSHGFVDKQTHQHTCSLFQTRHNVDVKAAISNLQVLKTRGSSFEGYLVDEYTTLKPARDRIMSSKANITWTYDDFFDLKSIDHNKVFKKVKDIAVQTFVSHDESKSVQHTIDLIAHKALNEIKELSTIHLNLPNVHYLLSNIKNDFGLENNNEIFVPIIEPYGNIYAQLSKASHSLVVFNKLEKQEAHKVVQDITGSKSLQEKIVEHRPYRNVDDVLTQIEASYPELNESELKEVIISKINKDKVGKVLRANAHKKHDEEQLAVKAKSCSLEEKTGKISSHVLDLSVGRPAEDIEATLMKRDEEHKSWSTINKQNTNKDGRVGNFLDGQPLEKGIYKVVFNTGAYFAKRNLNTFYPRVSIKFSIEDNKQNYHIPLLLNQFGYSTYRGS